MKHNQFAKMVIAYMQQEAAATLGVSRRSQENWAPERAMPQGAGINAMLRISHAPDAKAMGKSKRRHKRGK